MDGKSQMQGGKNWIFPKEMNAYRFFRDYHWLEIWKNHLCPSMGPNGWSVAMDFLLGCPRKKQKKHFGSNRNKPKQDLFRLCFGLFRRFEPRSKELKQTKLFRN